jgi:hypothetical protein
LPPSPPIITSQVAPFKHTQQRRRIAVSDQYRDDATSAARVIYRQHHGIFELHPGRGYGIRGQEDQEYPALRKPSFDRKDEVLAKVYGGIV